MRSRSGFSMMEVAIAILVLAIAIPATLATVAYTMREAGVLIRESTAAMTAKTVLNQPGWGDSFLPINGYEAKRTVTPVDLPASPDGLSTVRVNQVEVVLQANGHQVMTLTAYEATMMATNRSGLTLVELLVAITLMIMISAMATMTFTNVDKATRRSLALIRIHQDAAALMQRLEEDLENLQPVAAINLSDHHLTFVRAHGEGLELEEDTTSSNGTISGGRYVHDLIWVRWTWQDGMIRRASTPTFSTNVGESYAENTVFGGSAENGRSISPQQFYHYFEPVDLPDRLDPDASSVESELKTWMQDPSKLGPVPSRGLDTDIYWKPETLWWHPGKELGPNRGRPGQALSVELGSLVDIKSKSGTVTSITWKPDDPVAASPSDAPRVAFQMVNPSGWTTNRDYLHLTGVHPDDPLHQQLPSPMTIVAQQVLSLQVRLYGHDHDASGKMLVDGTTKSGLLASDSGMGAGAYAGMPRNPSSDLDPGRGGLDAKAAPIPGASKDFDQRPVKMEIAFVMHSIPPNKLDFADLDGDLVTDESLAAAIYDRLAKLGPVDDQVLMAAIAEQGYVATAFNQAVILPH